MGLTDLFLPLPLRWLWLLLYGLFGFWIACHFLTKYAGINAGTLLYETDENASAQNFLDLLRRLFIYSVISYICLRLLIVIVPSFLSPVFVFIFVTLSILQPFNFGGLSIRYRFVRCLGRIFFGSMNDGTLFSDLILADVLTSYSKVLADWDALLWCYLLRPIVHQGDALDSVPGCVPSLLSVFFVCLPYLIRFKQCLADYRLSRDRKQLVNAFKYFSSFPTIYLAYVFSGNATCHYLVSWIITLAINFVVSCLWDILIDWDLGHLQNCGNREKTFPWMLRSNLIFKQQSYIYYLAIVFNVLVRGLWIQRMYLIVQKRHEDIIVLDSELGFVIIQCLEIARRLVWFVFRAEVQFMASNNVALSASSYSRMEEAT